jgi:hypothetical protein
MNKFERRFFAVLHEQDEQDRAAMVSTLDQDTDPGEFDVDVDSQAEDRAASELASVIAKREVHMISKLKGWITLMEDFLEALNGTGESIQTELSNAESETLLGKMKASEQRKIARVATEVAALNESFKGYLAQSKNSSLKYV